MNNPELIEAKVKTYKECIELICDKYTNDLHGSFYALPDYTIATDLYKISYECVAEDVSEYMNNSKI